MTAGLAAQPQAQPLLQLTAHRWDDPNSDGGHGRITTAVTLSELTVANGPSAADGRGHALSWRLPAASIHNVRGSTSVHRASLLAAIGAIERPLSGTLSIGGFEVWLADSPRRRRFLTRCVGHSLLGTRLDADLSVFDNLMLPLLVSGVPRDLASQRVFDELVALDIADCAACRPQALTDQQHRLAVHCRALMVDPAVAVFEVPEFGLDDASVACLRRALWRLARQGHACVVMATEDERLHKLVDSTLWLR